MGLKQGTHCDISRVNNRMSLHRTPLIMYGQLQKLRDGELTSSIPKQVLPHRQTFC